MKDHSPSLHDTGNTLNEYVIRSQQLRRELQSAEERYHTAQKLYESTYTALRLAEQAKMAAHLKHWLSTFFGRRYRA